ncbi:hypothetical protein ACFL0Z_00080 [Patescibacteria group bacterium]
MPKLFWIIITFVLGVGLAVSLFYNLNAPAQTQGVVAIAQGNAIDVSWQEASEICCQQNFSCCQLTKAENLTESDLKDILGYCAENPAECSSIKK